VTVTVTSLECGGAAGRGGPGAGGPAPPKEPGVSSMLKNVEKHFPFLPFSVSLILFYILLVGSGGLYAIQYLISLFNPPLFPLRV
jgi:hypothetical protein